MHYAYNIVMDLGKELRIILHSVAAVVSSTYLLAAMWYALYCVCLGFSDVVR